MNKPTYEELERERNELAARVERLQLAILNAIPFVPGGSVKADLRDAYDETPPAALAALKAQWQAEYEHCDHKYARFGDQPHRRCIRCSRIEHAQEAGDA